jgi:hypothetical protein
VNRIGTITQMRPSVRRTIAVGYGERTRVGSVAGSRGRASLGGDVDNSAGVEGGWAWVSVRAGGIAGRLEMNPEGRRTRAGAEAETETETETEAKVRLRSRPRPQGRSVS